MIDENEHRDHIDNAAYQAAIERAAIQETGESTEGIKARTVIDGTEADREADGGSHEAKDAS